MNYTEIVVFVQLIISLLSLVMFVLLVSKFVADSHKDYNIHRFTKTLSLLAFFMFLDSTFFCISYFSSLGLSAELATLFSTTGFQFYSTLGIFISLVVLTYLIFDKRIEEIKKNEDELSLMKELNTQLEKKARDLESEDAQQHKKISELEKFNAIAKEREKKMINLTNKIESLKGNLEKKGE